MKSAKHTLKTSRRSLSGSAKRLSKPAPLPRLQRLQGPAGVPQPTLVSLAVYGALAALALGSVVAQTSAWAQDVVQDTGAPLSLKSGGELLETLPVEVRDALPTFVRSQSMESKSQTQTVFEGEVELRRHDTVIRADRLEFDQQSQEAKASGNVLINRNGDRFTGPEMQMNVETFKGHFEQPEYQLLKNGGVGDASRIDFVDRNTVVVQDGRYSTCERLPGSQWMPDWLIRASSIELDTAEDVGTAKGGVLEFKGVPILAAPYLTFPLSDKRKSGALPPSMSIDSDSGVQLAAPYYFNIAPNMDATLTPRVMSKRGVDLGGELRYLEPSFSGYVQGAFMPSDQLRDEDRWSYSLQHRQTLVPAFAGGSDIGLRLRLNRVSDDNYWSDFPRSITGLTSRLLGSDATLGWAKGPWSVGTGVYKWQALQVDDATYTPPFDILPVSWVNYRQPNQTILGSPDWDVSMQSNFTRFERSALAADSTLSKGGDRTLLMGRLSRRVQASGWYVQPSAQLHGTQYSTIGANGGANVAASRVVPTLSVDSGLTFERSTQFFGTDFTQTLEPRAFLTWTPYRDQSGLPNYDSGSRDLSLATLYAENAFNGSDRISDTRAVTMGASSRLISPDTGAEVARLSLAQRYYLTDQNVTLPDETAVSKGFGDMLLSGRVQWDPRWSLDSTVQFNFEDNRSERLTVGGRYVPGPYKVLSAAYRYDRDETSEYLDLGWQWPLASLLGRAPDPSPGRALGPNQWYSVGRINYSMLDRKVVDLVAGFEYDAGCWLGRVVLQRLQTSTTESNESILFQLEFSGFSRVGASSLQSLQTNVPGYRYLREEVNPPSRYPTYD
ncbi:LPS-assembly protein LptD [Hydrogenophaga sp. PAMC20947]|uniref:LPS-assembly protein LptD n=1 Tax=Hydrogenophaga sp. PAMC20947 TaxID=2565558 RepID=UPI00109E05CA|nr:LPS-assembly protein LptD [Hydrogenophaga sp. PAMC20947]QCB47718.1 LPS-assembly protein LptD [Hydrogenophaga sp. PAMC20947]